MAPTKNATVPAAEKASGRSLAAQLSDAITSRRKKQKEDDNPDVEIGPDEEDEEEEDEDDESDKVAQAPLGTTDYNVSASAQEDKKPEKLIERMDQLMERVDKNADRIENKMGDMWERFEGRMEKKMSDMEERIEEHLMIEWKRKSKNTTRR